VCAYTAPTEPGKFSSELGLWIRLDELRRFGRHALGGGRRDLTFAREGEGGVPLSDPGLRTGDPMDCAMFPRVLPR
jgi:hypothetical protein